MKHPHRVVNWLDGKTTYPIYVEISPTRKALKESYKLDQPTFISLKRNK